MSSQIEHLNWDSEYFGFSVARIILERSNKQDYDNIIEIIQATKNRLTYIMISPEEIDLNKKLVARGALLVDQRIIFEKETKIHDEIKWYIKEYEGEEIRDDLMTLAIQAGRYSRFNNDKNIPKTEFERLYVKWITNSVNKSYALKTLYASDESKIIGIITLRKNVDKAEIGLVSVDDLYRGRGIGKSLVQAADSVAFHLGYPIIKVATQAKNEQACRLYRKCCFEEMDKMNIYHYWQSI